MERLSDRQCQIRLEFEYSKDSSELDKFSDNISTDKQYKISYTRGNTVVNLTIDRISEEIERVIFSPVDL